jgi:peptidoglycan hydrolase-like protein with peptidoglycan-binding domain
MTLLPGAVWRPVSYRLDAGAFAARPLGWCLHAAASNGSLFNFFNGLASPNRKFSTAWVAKDGSSEQYTELENKPWSQVLGNANYWGFETEGFGTEPLTDAQLDTLARWHKFLSVANVAVNVFGQRGVIPHYAIVATACPMPLRSSQRPEIIRRAGGLVIPPLPAPLPPILHPVPKSIYLPAFPLPAMHVFGPRTGPAWQHSGFYSVADRNGLRVWQSAMVSRGWTITVDGLYGAGTAKVAMQFQREKGLTVDGLIGKGTWDRTRILP